MNMLICHSRKFGVFNCDAKIAVEETHTVCSCCRISRIGRAGNEGGGNANFVTRIRKINRSKTVPFVSGV